MDEDLGLLEKAVAAGEDVNALIHGSTPLSAAAQMDNLRFAEMLLQSGADVNGRDVDGTTALYWSQSSSMVRLLIANGAKVTAECSEWQHTSVHEAAEHGRLDKLVLLLGADGIGALECLDYAGRTPIACAAQNGHEAIVQLLLDRGANPDTVEMQGGQTALQRALTEGHVQCARLLLSYGADPDFAPGMTEKPMRIAIDNGLLSQLNQYFRRCH